MPKRILVTTETSRNKMLAVASLVKQHCERLGMAVECEVRTLSEVRDAEIDHDLVVHTGSRKLDVRVPVVSGVPFLTRLGMERAAADIVARLKG